jgi:hypothetical protein
MAIRAADFRLVTSSGGVNFRSDLPDFVDASIRAAADISQQYSWGDHLHSGLREVVFQGLGGPLAAIANGNNFGGDLYFADPENIPQGQAFVTSSGGVDVINIKLVDSTGEFLPAKQISRTIFHEMMHSSRIVDHFADLNKELRAKSCKSRSR